MTPPMTEDNISAMREAFAVAARKVDKEPLKESWEERKGRWKVAKKERDVKKTKRDTKRLVKKGKQKTISSFFK